MEARRDAKSPSPVEGVGAAISASVAEDSSRVAGQDLPGQEGKLPRGIGGRRDPVRAAEACELAEWKAFHVT